MSMPEEYDFIEQVNGEPYLEVQSSGEYISLDAVITEYDEKGKTPLEVAEFFHMGVEDVENGIVYWREQSNVFNESQDSGDTVNNQSQELEPLNVARNAFLEYMGEQGFEGVHLDTSPQENYFNQSSEEVHLNWEMNESDVAIYAGLEEEENRGLVSFSVDDKEGETIVINEGMKDWIKEMYSNVVFETRNIS